MTTPTKRRTLKKAAAPESSSEQLIKSLLDKVERVEVGSLKPHPKNPRQGNVTAVAQSLELNGQFKPIVVQKSTRTILAGNHTWLGARRNGWTHIDAVLVDVDDDKGLRILLADNKTSDASTYDESLLAEILAHVATTDTGLDGTGYDPAELQGLIDSVGKTSAEAKANLDEMMAAMPAGEFKTQTKREKYEEDREEQPEAKEGAEARGTVKQDKKVTAEDELEDEEPVDAEIGLQAVLEVKMDAHDFWKKVGKEGGDEFEIPPLREDMLLEELPKPLQTWGGYEATPDDGKSWFLYNYSLGGIKGLPFERSILAFNTHDDKFMGWWENPAWYVAKHLSKGLRVAVVPDFSFYYTQPRIIHLMSVYRAQWMGRFFQEAGMKIIPRLQFDYQDPHTLDIALRGIPRNCPILATSMQNIEDEKVNGPVVKQLLQDALDEIQPKQLLYYSGPPGRRIIEQVNFSGEVVTLENYVATRRGVVYDKKAGLQGKSGKDRQKILAKARKRLAGEAAKPEVEEDDQDE